MNNKNKKELIPTERTEFDKTIDKYLEGFGNGVVNSVLSVPYGIREAIHYSKQDVGILVMSLVPSVLLREYNIIPLIYTPIAYSILALSVRGWKYIIEKWQFDKAIRECGVMTDNHKYPKLKSIKHEGLRKTFVVNSCIPPSQFKIHAQKLKSTSNICITNIEQHKKKILLHTQKKGEIPEEYLEMGKYAEVFKSMELDVKVKDIQITEYFVDMYFNTEIYYSKLQTLIPELIHRLKVKNVEITTDSKFDYKLTVKKEVRKKQTFLSVWDSPEVQEKIKDMIIPVLVGINCDTGEIALYDMAKEFYHILIAGSTGWGKSVLIQNICSSILLANRDYIKCYFYDPKGTELNLYEGLNNVYFETDLNRIVNGLESLVDEMNRRNKLIKQDRFINNIYGWNKENPNKKMDFKVIVLEEISFFMESADQKLKTRFKSAVVKLSQLGRSAGMWLDVTTQNPVKEVIFGELKSNVETKAGCKTVNKTKSRTILDNNMCAEIKEKGKYVLQNKGSNVLHKSFWIQEAESKIIYYRIKQMNENKLDVFENPEISNDTDIKPEGLGENVIKPIENHYNLYLFYINIQGTEGKLPIRKEIMKQTGLTEWKLNQMDKNLRLEGKIINKGNDRIVVTNVDELANRRGK